MKTRLVASCLLTVLVFLWGGHAMPADELPHITVSCTNYPPFFYEQDGRIQGIGYVIAKTILKEAGLSATFKIMPWKRVYQTGKNKKDFMIVGLGRTARREKLFQWIGPINKGVDFNFVKLKENPLTPTSLVELKSYKIVVIRASHMHDFLLENGFPVSQIQEIKSLDLALKFLKRKRADFYLDYLDYSDPDTASFEPAFYGYTVYNYISLSNTTSPHIVHRLRETYERLCDNGTIVLTK